MTKALKQVQDSLGYSFSTPSLCTQALTHRSYSSSNNNERLEFLGDAVLDLLISELLYERYPSASEGELSHMRAQVVCGDNLAAIGRLLEIGESLNLGAGEIQSGGRERASSLANAVEALIAAVYLDGGMDSCRSVAAKLFQPILQKTAPGTAKDSKTRLQEYQQARQLPLPEYILLSRSGSDHEASFTMMCKVSSLNMQAEAVASSRKKAEQMAAEKILKYLEV
ncbi:MAG TPA: ribonuclease III [Pseudomonadales bacterium]|nr:ribonuclease III [Pseudomonadales bacterium]